MSTIKKNTFILLISLALASLFGGRSLLVAGPILFDASGVSVGATGYQFTHMVLADLDGDGDDDLLTGNALGQLTAWQNNGSPFSQGWPSVLMGRYYRPSALAAADLDGDGDLDVISGQRWVTDLLVWENDGSPFDGEWPRWLIGHDRAYIGAVTAADVNADGRVDIITGGGPSADVNSPTTNNRVTVWLNAPFNAAWQPIDVGEAYYSVRDIALGDLDADGDLDIVIGTNRAPAMGSSTAPVPRENWPNAYQVRVFRNDGADGWTHFNIGRDPEFETLSLLYHGFWGAHISSIALADLDGDGDLDIVASDHMEGDFQVLAFENDGDPFSGELWRGTAVSYPQSRFHNWVAANIMDTAVGDFDQDGDLDIASVSNQTETYQIIVWENLGGWVWEDWASMTLDPARIGHYSSAWLRHDLAVLGANMLNIGASDLDSDGDLDLTSVSVLAVEPNALTVWRNVVSSPVPAPSATPSPAPSATPSATPTETPDPSPTSTPFPTFTPTPTSTPSANVPPQNGVFMPNGGVGRLGEMQAFTTTYLDANGWTDVRAANFLMNVGLQGSGLSVVYYRDSNRLYLSNDDGSGWVGWCTPGMAQTVTNRYVSVDCGRTAVTGQADTLTIQWSITPLAPFSGSLGQYQVYLRVLDMSGLRSPWALSGVWILED